MRTEFTLLGSACPSRDPRNPAALLAVDGAIVLE
jgi:hypothetical protein